MTKFASVLLVSLLFPWPVHASPGEIIRARRPVPGSYIVQLSDFDTARPAARAAELARQFGGRVTAVWENAVRGFAVELNDAQALALSRNPFVKAVQEDGYGSVATSQTVDSSRWGLDRIDQANLPVNGSFNYCQDGTGVNIYIVDTGVWYLHNEFDLLTGGSNRVENGASFCATDSCIGSAKSPCDSGTNPLQFPIGAHGTMVASVAAGILNGVAKNANIIPVRAGDCYGNLFDSWVISAVDWVDADHAPGEPAVMNCSFTVDDNSSKENIIVAAFNDVIDDGVVVVVGAGNDNVSASTTLLPTIDRVITVGGTDRYDSRWVTSSSDGSNYGSKVDVFAPAKGIRVANSTSMTAMASENGTSLAAPFVSGVVAQYLQANPTATPEQVFAWIVSSATPGVLTNLGVGSPNLLLYSPCN